MQLVEHYIPMNAVSPLGVDLGDVGTILDAVDGQHL